MKRDKKLRVLTYNIHKGFGVRKGAFILAEIRNAVRALDIDLVFLQEVIGEHSTHAEQVENWPSEPQFEYLADSVWSHQSYGRNAVYPEGHHGNAILSKFEILQWSNHDISAGPYEKRGLLHARIEPQGDLSFHCFCTHLALFRKARKRQFKAIADLIGAQVDTTSPLILAGDFNDWRGDACKVFEQELGVVDAHKLLHGRLAKTFPRKAPILRLDRIYLRGFEVHSAETLKQKPWNSLSDHLPIVAEFLPVHV